MRNSIVTDYEDISAFSEQPAECHHHLLFGRGMRKLADEDGLWIPLTNREHNMSPFLIEQVHQNVAAEKLSKMLGQVCWEKHYIAETGCTEQEAMARFLKRYGRSYL